MKRIYWAGPLFTDAQREWNNRMARRLEEIGLRVHLPQENEPRKRTSRDIFIADIDGINWADTIIAVMDGADPDSGTCWEVGYGYSKGKKILLLHTDIRERKDVDSPFNIMLHQSAEVTFNSVQQLFQYLHDIGVRK